MAGAVAGTAYYRRDDIGSGYGWATDHMKYVRNLWDEDALQKRLQDLIDAQGQLGVVFRTYVQRISHSFGLFLSFCSFGIPDFTLYCHLLHLHSRRRGHSLFFLLGRLR
jgi:hypothetical protein